MNQNPNISTPIHEMSRSHDHQQRETIDFSKYFFLFLHNWYYFVIALMLAISGAYFYIKVVLPTYRVTATLLFDESEQNASITPDNIMQGIGLRPRRQNLENQVQLLSSWSMSHKCISELPFGVNYYEKNRFNSSDLYPSIPFHVISENTDSLPYGIEFSIYFIDEKNFHIITEENEFFTFNKKGGFGESLDGGNFNFSIQKDNKYWQPGIINRTLYFKFLSSHDINKSFRDRLDIVQQGMESTTILLSIEGAEWRKDLDYLSKLIEVFETSNLNKRNHEADRTIQFIDEQLSDITDSLLIAEDKLQEFRSQNRVMDISEQGSQVLEQAIRLEDERARLMIENDYFTYLNEYLSLEETVDQVIAPATMGISDPMVVSLVGQLAELQSEYYSLGAGGKNPIQINLSIRIQNTKRALQETLKGILRSNNYAIEENRTRLGVLNRQAESLPITERKLLGIEREFKLNDALYNFLLQKQAEAQIQKASTSSNTEIVDPPRVMDVPIWPKKKLIFLVAFLLGVVIPSVIIIIIDALNLKIDSEEKIKKFTDIPITGHILHNKNQFQSVVLHEPNSVIAESFRSLRTRLRFFIKETSSPVILLNIFNAWRRKNFCSSKSGFR